ncbi:OstA-like protein [Flavobacterium sp. RHBU_3]|uniref:OstA-like protein n=1 Tax=Flavobacterium sp. RHBU_3 TaxID=3391184 RepID=UPI0039848AB3
MKKAFLVTILLTLWWLPGFAQPKPAQKSKVIIENADYTDRNQTEIPGAVVLTGHVRLKHEGVTILSNKAYYFEAENYAKLFGDVVMNQGDTLYLNSKYAEYNGERKFAFASGNVSMKSPDTRLVTDTIYLDRNIQQAYYRTPGTITSGENVLKSKSGRYYIPQKKYQFTTAVTLTNPKYVMKSNHLDYYTSPGHAYVFGPTTITGKNNFIYTEKGFYDTKKDQAKLFTNSYIDYDTQRIKADYIYYDRKKEFSSLTDNVSVRDSVNKYTIRGHYGEVFKAKDSLFVTKHAEAVTLVETDSVYMHAKRMLVTGKEGARIIRGFNDARFYKVDMSGKCDSIHSDEAKGLTQLIKRPVVWNGDSQVTGDIIHLISDNKTQQLDSIKVLNNAFIVQLDTVWSFAHRDKPRYNQVKGVNLYGRFCDNKLYEIDLVKNTEKIYYMYDSDNTLIGIDKGVSSKIHLDIEDNQIVSVTSLIKPFSESYPENQFAENARKLRGFEWRGDERILTKDDIFPEEEKKLHEEILKKTGKLKQKEDKPLEPLKETLNWDKEHPKPKPEGTETTAPVATTPAVAPAAKVSTPKAPAKKDKKTKS